MTSKLICIKRYLRFSDINNPFFFYVRNSIEASRAVYKFMLIIVKLLGGVKKFIDELSQKPMFQVIKR